MLKLERKREKETTGNIALNKLLLVKESFFTFCDGKYRSVFTECELSKLIVKGRAAGTEASALRSGLSRHSGRIPDEIDWREERSSERKRRRTRADEHDRNRRSWDVNRQRGQNESGIQQR
jgi:hypothetical protein